MLDSDDSDFYISDHPIIDQEEQRIEIEKNEILENCVLSQTKLNCKLVKIVNCRGYPQLHFVIDEKMYFYGIKGIRADYKIILRCTKQSLGCDNYSSIRPLDLLKQIIFKNSSKINYNYSKMLNVSNPRVYDSKNYDLNSFDIGKGHKCQGTEIDVYLKS